MAVRQIFVNNINTVLYLNLQKKMGGNFQIPSYFEKILDLPAKNLSR